MILGMNWLLRVTSGQGSHFGSGCEGVSFQCYRMDEMGVSGLRWDGHSGPACLSFRSVLQD